LIGSASADGIARGEGRLRNLTGYALAVLHNGLAHYDEAYAAARDTGGYEDLGFHGWRLYELIEAATRTGNKEEARRAAA
ncbi:hypothetical protein C6A85_07965, partial [Mycobacterium sp. ITM-2017-0098]